MANLTTEQIEQKKQQLKQLAAEMNAIVKELQEAGEWPLDEDDLDKAAGGIRYADNYSVEIFNDRGPDGGVRYSNEELDRLVKKYRSKGWGCITY